MIEIVMVSDSAPFFANLFLAHKEPKWVKVQRKFVTINFWKINNSFRFIDDLVSLNDDRNFEKHYEDIYPTELELNKENNNFCASFLDMYIYTENGEFHTKLFDKRDNFGFDIVRKPLYCSYNPRKIVYGRIGVEFLRISRAANKIDLSRTCKQLLRRMLGQNGQMKRIKDSLVKMIQRHQEVFLKYKKSIEEVMKTISKYILEYQKSNTVFSIYTFYTLYIFLYSLFFIQSLYTFYVIFIFWHKHFSTYISIYLNISMFAYIYIYIYVYIYITRVSVFFLCFVYFPLC